MDWNPHAALSAQWRADGREYFKGIAQWIADGEARGWPEDLPPQPADPRHLLAEEVLAIVRAANAAGELDALREQFPPSFEPFANTLEKQGQFVRGVHGKADRIVAALGPDYAHIGLARIDDSACTIDTQCFFEAWNVETGQVAVATSAGVRIGDQLLPWPTGREGLSPDLAQAMAPFKVGSPMDMQLLPDGRVVVVTQYGIFALGLDGAIRLHPDENAIASGLEYTDGPLKPHMDMAHVSVSPDGRWACVGSQDGSHRVVDTRTGAQNAYFGPINSEYPHHASFSPDGDWLLVNSCHFYSGCSHVMAVEAILGAQIGSYQDDERFTKVDGGSRVYASVWLDDGVVVGDAHGYLRAWSFDGKALWRHHLGSTITGMYRCENRIYVGTAGGVLHVLATDQGSDEWAIGNAPLKEVRRWLFWNDEEAPLAW